MSLPKSTATTAGPPDLFVVAVVEDASLFGIHRPWVGGSSLPVVQAFLEHRDAATVARRLTAMRDAGERPPDRVLGRNGKFAGMTMFELMADDRGKIVEDGDDGMARIFKIGSRLDGESFRSTRVEAAKRTAERRDRSKETDDEIGTASRGADWALQVLCVPRQMLLNELLRAGIAVQLIGKGVLPENSTCFPPRDGFFYVRHIQDCWDLTNGP